MSYKHILKNLGLVKNHKTWYLLNSRSRFRYISYSKSLYSKHYLYNECIYNQYIIQELKFGLQQYRRYFHTTTFATYSNNVKEIPSSSNQNKSDSKTESADTKGNTNVTSPDPTTKGTVVVKKSLWEKIKNEVLHYYHGFRLLFLEIKVAFGILKTLTKGHTLTRRERKQLVRTSADLVRMLPFLVFIVVPFMEFLLPLYLKYFPFMLPSTFKVESKDKEFALQKLKGKLEIAKFLQEAIAESAAVKKGSKYDGIDLSTFSDFLKQVRESGLTANTDDILRFSHLFEDEVTLQSLNPKYLKALCKLLDINVIGPQAFLRFQLEMKLRQLKVDDKMISSEGVDKVPTWELQQLCRERGMRSFGVSEARLRYQLSQWLSLHLDKKVPLTLLLLSRVMYLPETLTPEEQLKQAILVLPKTVSNTAKLKAAQIEQRVDHKTKFEVIKEEQEVIKQERKEASQEAGVVSQMPPKTSEDIAPIIEIKPAEPDKAPTVKVPEAVIPPVVDIKPVPIEHKPEITAADLVHIESAVVDLEDKTTLFHKEELNLLKKIRDNITKKLSSRETVNADANPEIKVAKRLGNKLDQMIDEIEKGVENLEEQSSKTQQEQPVNLSQELKVEANMEIDKIDTPPQTKKLFINIDDLLIILKRIEKSFDEEKWKNILFILDENHDGKIEIDHLVKITKIIGAGDVKLSVSEISKVLEILNKEQLLAETKRLKK